MRKASHWKKMSCLVLSLCLMAGMTACGGQSDTGSSTAGGNSGKKEQVTLKAMLQYTSDSQKAAQDYATEKMKELMPEVTLELEVMPEDGDVTIETLGASGNLPDIYKSNAGLIELFLPSNNVLELDKYVESTGIEKRVVSGEQGSFWCEADNHCYAIPYASSESYLIYYNKKVFEDNNVEIPTNYSEFLEVVKTFSNKGITPLSLFKDPWVAPALYETIVTRTDPKGLISIDSGKTKMSEDLYVQSAERLEELIKAGLISKSAFSATNEEAMAAFSNNEAAMYANGIWAIKDLSASMGEGFGYLDYPLQDGAASDKNTNTRVGGPGIGGISVAPSSKNVDVAAEYACLMALELANGRYVHGESLSPFTTDEGIEQEVDLGEIAKQYAEDSQNFTSYTMFPWNWNHADTMNILSEELNKLMTGDYSVKEFIESSDKRMAEMLAEDE